ncbi:MAG: YkgJ family cysteine cluster protein [Desulfobacterales bacterium]|jgi:Fe-S-cluster containining protein
MKYIDIKELNNLPGIRLKPQDTFSFRCYPGIACFNHCCRNLNLFLYPYDVIRLKNNLRITSGQFLDRYVDILLRQSNFFPAVLMRMSDKTEKTCPFLEDSGCLVYPDRPDTCRTFPVEQGIKYDARQNKYSRIQFFRPPDFCLGQHEDKVWTPETWAQDQRAVLYNEMTVKWAELKGLFREDPWGAEGPQGPKAKMAFMATYNIDRFRDFVFNSSFLKRCKFTKEEVKKLATDDVELLKLAFDWVRFFVWGIESHRFRLRKAQ